MECMKKLNVTAEQVEEMEVADEPNDTNDCFFGCYLLQANWVNCFNDFEFFFSFIQTKLYSTD